MAGTGDGSLHRMQYGDGAVCPACRSTLTQPPTVCAACGLDVRGHDAWQVLSSLRRADELLSAMLLRQGIALPYAGQAGAVPAPPETPPIWEAPEPVAPTVAEPEPVAPTVAEPEPEPAVAPPASPAPTHPAPADWPQRPVTPPLQPLGVKPSAVPKILLGLGALCLVVAAIVFLAVAWSVMGVGGRTGVVLVLTAIAGAATAWGAMASLRAAAEAFTAVTLGLLTAACFGAREAGWFGRVDDGPFLLLTALVLIVAGTGIALAARRTPEPELVLAELGVGVGLLVGFAGLVAFQDEISNAAIGALGAVGAGAVTAAMLRLRLRIAARIAGALAVLSWLVLASSALTAHSDYSLHAFWAEGEVWSPLVAAALAGVVAAVRPVPLPGRVTAACAGVMLAVLALTLPAFDEPRLTVTLVALAVVTATVPAAYLIRQPWTVVTAAPTVLAGGFLAATTAALALFTGAWTMAAAVVGGDDRGLGDPVEHADLKLLDPVLLPVGTVATAAALLVLARCLGADLRRQLVAPTAGLALTGAALMLPLYDAPLAACIAGLVVVALLQLALALRRADPVALVFAALPAVVALVASCVSAGSLAVVTGVYAAAAVVLEVRRHGTDAAQVASLWFGTIAVCATADVAGLGAEWWALLVIPLAGGVALLLPQLSREVAAGAAMAVTGLVSSSAVGSPDGELALAGFAALTAGFAVAGHALRHDRVHLGWAGLLGLGFAAVTSVSDDRANLALCALLTVVAVWYDVRERTVELAWVNRVVAPAAGAAVLWHLAGMAGVERIWQALPLMLVLGVVVLAWPRVEREAAAGLTAAAFVLGALSVTGDVQAPLATYLCLAGVVETLSAVIRRQRVGAGWAGLVLLALASLVALGAGWPGVAVLAVATLAGLWHDLAPGDEQLRRGGRFLAPLTAGALLFCGGRELDVAPEWTALVVLLVLGGWAVWRVCLESELACALAAGFVVLVTLGEAGGDIRGWLALYLTVAGVVLTGSALLHAERRMLSWAGLACFAVAQWLRLAQLGVETVEAYTLPLAVVLLVIGVVALRRTSRGTVPLLGPGLSLALVPTLLHVLVVDPVSLRTLLLGLACLALVGLGVGLRWVAPLVAGAVAGGLVVLRQASQGSDLPQWLLIAIAGVILTVMGVTWEKRLNDARRAAAYLRALR